MCVLFKSLCENNTASLLPLSHLFTLLSYDLSVAMYEPQCQSEPIYNSKLRILGFRNSSSKASPLQHKCHHHNNNKHHHYHNKRNHQHSYQHHHYCQITIIIITTVITIKITTITTRKIITIAIIIITIIMLKLPEFPHKSGHENHH